jgi:hypothetical protein
MRNFLLFLLALLSVALAACASEPGPPTVWSTEGSTLVRAGEVTAVNDAQLTVRLQDGELRAYPVEAGVSFRVGDRVKLISHKGETRITR